MYDKRFQRKHITDQDVKVACNEAWRTKELVDTVLSRNTGAPRKVSVAKLYQCANRGLVNYGVSINRCWWECDSFTGPLISPVQVSFELQVAPLHMKQLIEDKRIDGLVLSIKHGWRVHEGYTINSCHGCDCTVRDKCKRKP